MSQSIRHREIIFDGLPDIIAPLVFSSASSSSHCFKQALRNLYALPARKSDSSLLFHFELHFDMFHGSYPQLSKNDSVLASSLPNSDVSIPNTPKNNPCLLDLGNYCPRSTEHSFHDKYTFSNRCSCSKPLWCRNFPMLKTQPSASMKMGGIQFV